MSFVLPTPATPYPPTEIWRLIFRFATISKTRYDVDYGPFQRIREPQETSHSLQPEEECPHLQTCISLVRVSRGFNAIAAEFLYEDVRISDGRGLESFIAGLSRSAGEDGPQELGKFVRRLELQWKGTSFTPQSHSQPLPFPTDPIPSASEGIHLVDIFHFCPNLEIFVRHSLGLEANSVMSWASLIETPFTGTLPRLMRLEWHESEADARFHGTNHTNQLREILSRAPNLRYLSLSSDRQNSLADLTLPVSLRTLRLNRSQFHSNDARKSRERSQHFYYIPNFRNLVLHTTLPPTLLDFLASAGQQLSTLELAFAPQMVFSTNQMQRLLSRCPRLEEMVYHVGAPEISPLATFQCSSIRRVRLKFNPEEWSPYRSVFRSQTDVLEGRSFPKLEEVVLHDPKRWFIRRDSGKDLISRMQRRGCAVRYDDGTSVTLPT